MGAYVTKPTDVGSAFLRYSSLTKYDMIRYDTRCYFNVRSTADMEPHGTDN